MLLLNDRKVCLGNVRVAVAGAHQRSSFERVFVGAGKETTCLRRWLASLRCAGLCEGCYDDLEYPVVQVGHVGDISWSGRRQGFLGCGPEFKRHLPGISMDSHEL